MRPHPSLFQHIKNLLITTKHSANREQLKNNSRSLFATLLWWQDNSRDPEGSLYPQDNHHFLNRILSRHKYLSNSSTCQMKWSVWMSHTRWQQQLTIVMRHQQVNKQAAGYTVSPKYSINHFLSKWLRLNRDKINHLSKSNLQTSPWSMERKMKYLFLKVSNRLYNCP